jgi:hypothetical protein
VALEISPEPTPEEREVLVRALAALDGRANTGSAWWEAGIRESVEEEPEKPEEPEEP